MDKMKLWNDAFVTDPDAVKPITGKQYKGNSPKPFWIIQRATEILGPCGIGWRPEVVSERIERFGQGENEQSIHIAQVRVHYEYEGKSGVVEQMGQTKMAYKSKNGYMVDEDAPKKSVTDAMIKCLSMLGFAGDIFSGRWDDSGYVQWAADETARRNTPALELMSDDQVSELAALISETGTDFNKFMQWISKGAGKECKTLADAPVTAYAPAIKQLNAKKAQ